MPETYSTPHEISDQLLQVLTQSRQVEFDGFQGASHKLDQYKAHRLPFTPLT
jgi:hypothetical protein